MKNRHWLVGLLLSTTATILVDIPISTWLTSAAFSLILGATALVYMAMSCLLASRWKLIENIFGGLDRVYDLHKWLGIWALIFATYHFVFKANLNVWDSAPILDMSSYWARLVRQLSYVALGFIVLLALNRNIPYSVWRWWHKLSGPLFLIVILHWISFKSPITLGSPSGIWLMSVCVLAVIAAAYKLTLYPFLARTDEYQVTAVTRKNETLHLTLIPKHKGFYFKAGQFAFLSIKQEGLREPHPFTIASANEENGQIEFLIRSLGDYTKKLSEQVKIGMLADIYAPYGRFRRHSEAEREIWIGAGVGISPFVSWLKDPREKNLNKATLIYCFNPSRAFPSAEEMLAIAENRGVKLVCNDKGFDVLVETMHQAVKETAPGNIQVSFCGPKGLLIKVREVMQSLSIPHTNLHFELFEFR